MRRFRVSTAVGSAALAALCSTTGVGCSSADEHAAEPTTAPSTPATSEQPPLPPEPTEPGTAGISPDGVTTVVDVPSDATESQYGQACHAAKVWMDNQGGEATTLVEPYLKILQTPDFRDPGNFDTPWAELTPAQQAGVIVAVNAAAAGDCA